MSYAMRQQIGREQARRRLHELSIKRNTGELSEEEKAEIVKVANQAIGGDQNKAISLWLKGEIGD